MLRILANREQNKKNFMQIVESKTGCCGTEKTECQYSYSNASLKEVTSITVLEETFSLSDTPKGSEILAVYTNMADGEEKVKYTRQVVLPYLFREAGLFSDGMSVRIENSGQDFIVESETPITFNSVDPSTTKCVRTAICDYCATMGSVENPKFTIDGTDITVTGDWTYGETDVSAIQTAISTGLSSSDVLEVVVVDDEVNQLWRVILTYPCGTDVSLADEEVKVCQTYQDWVA